MSEPSYNVWVVSVCVCVCGVQLTNKIESISAMKISSLNGPMKRVCPVNPASQASRVVNNDRHRWANVPRYYGDTIFAVHVRSFDFSGNIVLWITSIRPEHVTREGECVLMCMCNMIFMIISITSC